MFYHFRLNLTCTQAAGHPAKQTFGSSKHCGTLLSPSVPFATTMHRKKMKLYTHNIPCVISVASVVHTSCMLACHGHGQYLTTRYNIILAYNCLFIFTPCFSQLCLSFNRMSLPFDFDTMVLFCYFFFIVSMLFPYAATFTYAPMHTHTVQCCICPMHVRLSCVHHFKSDMRV